MVSPTRQTVKPSPHKGRKQTIARTPSPPKTRGTSAYDQGDEEEKKGWTPRRVEILLECLELAKTQMTRNVAGRIFTPKMSHIASALRRHTGYDFKDNQVKNYWARLKRLHGVFQKLMNQTGIHCDPVQGTITAEDHTWEEVLLPISYAECKSIRKNGFPLFLRVDAIIGDTRATRSRKHPACISPSASDSSDDLPIKQKKDSGDKADNMRMSGEKRKTVAYDQGGSSSASKKKNQSWNIMMAQSVSDLAQSLTKRSSEKEPQREEGSTGVQVQFETEVVHREKHRREALLNEAIAKRKEAKLTAVESVKCMKLFTNKDDGEGWVNSFLGIPPSEWSEILAHL